MSRFLAVIGTLSLVVSMPAESQVPGYDVHVHLHSGEESVNAYEAQLKATGQRVTGYGAMWFGGPNQAREGRPDLVSANNDALMLLAKLHMAITPIVTVHPYDGTAALAELTRVAKGGVKVLKLHPHTQRFDAADPRVLILVKHAGKLGIVVLMDNANIVPGDSEKLFNLALAAPTTNFIFAHLGGMNFRFWNTLKAARTAEGLVGNNIYFDISAIAALVADSPLAEEFVWTIRNVGVDHVLLGSDFPQYSYAQSAAALDRLPLNDTEKAQIRSSNAVKLLKVAPVD